METGDLLKDPILASTNGAHESSKEVDGLEVAANVSDLQQPSILSVKDTPPVISKEFSPLPDRKELSPDPSRKGESPVPFRKEESPVIFNKEESPEPPKKEESPETPRQDESSLHSSKESSPMPLSKEPSPLPIHKDFEEASPHEQSFVKQNNELSSFQLQKDDDSLHPQEISPQLVQSDNPVISGTEAFLLSESIDSSLHPPLTTEPLLQSIPNEFKEATTINSSSETKVFPSTVTPEAPVTETEVQKNEPIEKEEDTFGFNKPLPPEPIESTADFLKSETTICKEEGEMKPMTPMVVTDDDFVTDEAKDAPEDGRTSPRKSSPSPPPVPKHQNLLDDPSERYEPSQTPEPDFAAFKPVSSVDDKFGEPVEVPEPEVPSFKPTVSPKVDVSEFKQEELPEEPKMVICSAPQKTTDIIGTKDIRSKIVESLLYWRDPKKSGAVFGVAMVSLLSLTYYSLISVVAYLCLFTLAGTITFRVYKNIMQAVQKTSDGHPFKDLLEVDLTIPEDKVSEVSHCLVQYLNTSLTTMRSLFLVEDLIDSIKFVILLWVLTYIGACFNGLTLIIIGVILLFSLPKVYENNKAQIDIYVKMAMDKLSVITNRMKAAVPEGKKDEKPKDQ